MSVERIKVLEFISRFAVGGTERQFLYFTKGVNRKLFDVQIGCFRRDGEFLQEIEDLQMPIRQYQTRQFYHPLTMLQQLRLAREIRREGIHLIHTYNWGPNIFGVPAGRLSRRCVVVASVRDTGVYLKPSKQKTLFAACRWSDCILANCNAVRDWLIAAGIGQEKLRVIRNGIVALKWFRKVPSSPIRPQLGIEPDAPVITFVGRLGRGKGVEFLLESVAILAERHPSVRLLIVGDHQYDKAYRTHLDAMAKRLNVFERTIFAGMRDDVPALLHASNIFVLPSLSEGLSNVLLEGMAARLPVVATRVGGNPEVVVDGTTGFLVPPENARELANSLGRLLDNPAMAQRFGELGQARIVEHFSVESMIHQTEEVYLQLVEKRFAGILSGQPRSTPLQKTRLAG